MSAKRREYFLEAAIVAAIEAGGLRKITVAGQEYPIAIRATWMDDADGGADEADSPAEGVEFPAILIDASGARSEESLRNGTAWEIPVSIVVTTWNQDDRKMRVGIAIYEALRGILEAEGLTMETGDFDALTIEDGGQWQILDGANGIMIQAHANMHD
jgi:hypothetical protein